MARRSGLLTTGISSKRAATVCGIIGAVILLFSAILIFIAVDRYNYAKRAVSEGESIYATCTQKWSETKTRTHKSKSGSKKRTTTTYYYANAEYTYNGQKYYCNKLSVSSSTQVGTKINIYVLPENPARYVEPGDQNISLSGIIFFASMIVVGMSLVFSAISANRRFNRYGSVQNLNSTYHNNGMNNTYQGYNNPNNTYQGYNNPNNTYQGYNNPNNTYQGYNDSNNTYQGHNNQW